MQQEFKVIGEKRMVGISLLMSFSANRTYELWRSFMPERKMILNTVSDNLFSIQNYHDSIDFAKPDPESLFEKWAAAEVADFNSIPAGMCSFIIPEGLYAVFTYKGDPQAAAGFFRYIFETWMPGSGYSVDNRPHFEILGERYKNNEPDSEEEIWIPVKPAEQS